MTTTVSALKAGTKLERGVFLIVNPQTGSKGNGEPYLRCLLRDATGEVAGRKWTFDPDMIGQLERSTVVEVDGEVVAFKGQPQIHMHDVRPIEATPAQLQALLPTSSRDNDDMFAQVRRVLDSLETPWIRGLIDAVFDDDALVAQFRRAPAAVSMHHAWIGGLMEHTLQMLLIGESIVSLYAQSDVTLDRDLVLAGIFFHDLAKTTELKWGDGFSYTLRGNLVGHIVDGAQLIESKVLESQMAGAPEPSEAQLAMLLNIVLSHHGRPEYGAAKSPMTPEAVLVSRIDELEAHTRMAVDAIKGRGEGMTETIKGLGHRLYSRGDA
ncbi:MAG: HD domain-containing protein [Phycisphaerales bacterium]|nr:HD domain-containing protein [Phycisphaerales bacterium]